MYSIQVIKKFLVGNYLSIAKWSARYWRKLLLFGGGGLVVVILAVQLAYPPDRLLPFSSVDALSFSAWKKSEAADSLDRTYKNVAIPIYFGESKTVSRSPLLAHVGIVASNMERLEAMRYPWYLRLVPTSILWAHKVVKPVEYPKYVRNEDILKSYIAKELNDSCVVAPQNASLKFEDGTLRIIPSSRGGICDPSDVERALKTVRPLLNDIKITIVMKPVDPAVQDDHARELSKNLKDRAKEGVPLVIAGSQQIIPTAEVFAWMDFTTINQALEFTLNTERAKAGYLDKEVVPKVAVAAGITKVATHDFTEISRVNGTEGKTIDEQATVDSVKQFLLGVGNSATAKTKSVSPVIQYTRTYSPTDTGIAALMKNFAESHPGIYGIRLVELGGSRRHAGYNEAKSFTTASTYKLFIAYGALKRIEEGSWQWSDQIQGGRDLAKCFDDMIVKSDNACAEALLQKIGFKPITNEIRSLGLSNETSFLGSDGIKTTAGDLSLFLSLLQSGQMLTQQSSRDRLLDAMKRSQHRQGIPAGATGTVANKVGFLDGLLHDAAVVYSPSGTYVLVVMTEGSSWAAIADLTRQLETLRVS